MEQPRYTLREVATIGTFDGPGAFGRVVDLAFSDDSVLAVVDAYGCAIKLLAPSDYRTVAEFGACGPGPGEFRDIHGIAFEGDSLWIFDAGRRRLLVVLRDGTEVAARTPGFLAEAPGLASLSRSDGKLVFSPMWVGPSERRLLAVEDGPREVRGIEDSQRSLRNRDRSLARFAPSCAFRSGRSILVANAWQIEALVVDEGLEPIAVTRARRDWYTPRPGATEGEFTPASFPVLTCGDSVGVVRYRTNDLSAGRAHPRVAHALLLVVDKEGTTSILEEVADTAWPSVTAMAPGAGIGNLFAFYSNGFGPYPIIRLLELEPLEREGPSGGAQP